MVTDALLSECDREPIHIPGSIQPHGALLVLDQTGRSTTSVSDNVPAFFGRSATELLGQSLTRIFGEVEGQRLESSLLGLQDRSCPVLLGTLTVNTASGSRPFDVIGHRVGSNFVVECEPADPGAGDRKEPVRIAAAVELLTNEVESAATIGDLCRRTAAVVRKLVEYDRVLIYQFDDSWNGTVVGEDGNGRLPNLLDHRFPASDIPAQARELYRVNRIRIIPDAAYVPVPLRGLPELAGGPPLDMTFSVLRSVSPIHVEYMRNMETASSMSFSILRNGRLWGLISCHHRSPRFVPFAIRTTCDLMARIFALRLSVLDHTHDSVRRRDVQSTFVRLLAAMTERGNISEALAEQAEALLSFVRAEGGAVLTEGGCVLVGKTPGESQVRSMADWLFAHVREDVYATDILSDACPEALDFTDTASGLLAIAISKLHPSYVLWFRPEVIRTIAWGGDPRKQATADDLRRLHPRRSFETWRETVRRRSHPWNAEEVEGAAELRNAIVGIVLRKAEELAALNEELLRSNRELEAFSYSVSHDLRAPLRHIVGYAEMLKESQDGHATDRDRHCIETIIESSEYAGKLVEKLLAYSRLGRAELQIGGIDMNVLIREIQQDVSRDAEERAIEWRIGSLPDVCADLMMLRMAVRDLLSNAIKYTRKREQAIIEIGGRPDGSENVYWVKDNGVGFDMQYADKLFGVFQRLHRWEDYEGTGIGLANVQRVMERHGGRTWASGEEGVGATFYFSLPK
jgi:light-regulated signal transduction histidine kinase (bacteriophytochrome)